MAPKKKVGFLTFGEIHLVACVCIYLDLSVEIQHTQTCIEIKNQQYSLGSHQGLWRLYPRVIRGIDGPLVKLLELLTA